MDHPILKKAIVKCLQDVINGKAVKPTMGLCNGLPENLELEFESNDSMAEAAINLWVSIQDDLYRRWPKFSGNICYPVPASVEAQDRYDNTPDFYSSAEGLSYTMAVNKYEGEAGKLRLELAQFIVNELKVELNHR